ncbi:hypothetical protein RDV89_02875 [Nocardioides zeae]|uniref:SWIM-type domain-containing protein n=1 Tax=Nocardioides imazamoxiresistens TaxID=3231893 RepID=A0ABU3PRZ5_9ACTN|nr:hypothetical protein [Nocardioides zeae]MDT9591993.1 hypothetical protein [Nocardioides zeae]
MIPDLTGLTPDVLRDLTNVGTVRRATRDLEEGTVTVELVETDAGLEASASDGSWCLLGAGAFDTWRCDCAAGGSCRHVVRAVLAHRAAGAAGAAPAACPTDTTAAQAPPVVDARTARAAAAAREAYGLVAVVRRGERTTVVLHVPAEATVRLGADADPRFARCDCGAPGCAHLDHATAALAVGPDDGLVASPAATPGLTRPDPELVARWHAWWGRLLDLGLSASEELVAAGVGLATALEDAGLPHPGAVARDLVAQLAHHAARDAEVSPTRIVTLAGELEVRLRSLDRPGGVPAALVAGVPEHEEPVGAQRLVGLGAEHLHVGGWSRLRVYLGDVRSGAVRTLTVEAVDTEDVRVSARRLGARSRSGSTYAAWAAAAFVLPRSRRRGAELVLPRGTAPVQAATRWEVPEDSPLFAPHLGAVAGDVDVPAALAPRGSVAGLGALRVAAVEDVATDPSEDLVAATLRDVTGATARLELPVSSRARDGARATAALLASGGTTAVAGRWVRRSDGLVVRPTLLDGPAGPLVVPLGDGADDAAAVPSTSPVSVPGTGSADPWQRLLHDVTEIVGRLLVLGSRRGAATARRDLQEAATTAAGLGLLRWSGVLAGAARDPGPDHAALLDVAVLLEMAR